MHFDENSSYDYVKYQGKLNYSKDSFEKSNENKFFFAKLASRYSKEDFVALILAKCLEDNNFWIGDLLTEDAKKLMFIQLGKIQKLSYTFENELQKILEENDIRDLIRISDPHTNPLLLSLYLQNEIGLETLIILDTILYNFTNKWNKVLEDTIVWPDIYYKISKYRPFLNIDTTKYYKILVKNINNSTKNNEGKTLNG